jgi:GntR family transcriptional regulator / MocR family aminotransferase
MRAAGWADLYAWRVDRDDATPLFRQIYVQVRSAILSQALRPGTKLPSTREVASRLGVARASVVSAYEQLLAEGYLSGKVGSGTYISSDLPEPIDRRARSPAKRPAAAIRRVRLPAQTFEHAFEYVAKPGAQSDPRPFNLGRSLVDARTLEVWRKISHRAFRSLAPIHLGYSDARGLIELRQTICDYLRATRAVNCEPEQIVVTAGTQHAIDITIRVLLAPGDEVWVEEPCYPMTYGALAAAKVKFHHIPVDTQGIDVSVGTRAGPRARAVFVTPSHQFPLGVVLSMARRLELLAWARGSGAWIIEDDYHSEFQYSGRPLASLQGLDDANRVIYVGTLNKVLFPGLRMGYVVVPQPLVRAFVGARYLMDRQPSTLHQTVVVEFMRQGYFAAHIRRMRLLYRDQRDLLVAQLTRATGTNVVVQAPEQGMHLVANLCNGLSDINIEHAARERDVIVRAMSRLYKAAPPRSALILGFAGYPHQMLVPAVARLARVIGEQLRLSKRLRRNDTGQSNVV